MDLKISKNYVVGCKFFVVVGVTVGVGVVVTFGVVVTLRVVVGVGVTTFDFP
jgi:tetrahydrodipicolinate N-succinyltransferase